jgi:hypothetical protein
MIRGVDIAVPFRGPPILVALQVVEDAFPHGVKPPRGAHVEPGKEPCHEELRKCEGKKIVAGTMNRAFAAIRALNSSLATTSSYSSSCGRAVGVVAPARRVATVDPLTALRVE